MGVLLVLLLVSLLVPETEQWDISQMWNDLKEKITSIFSSSNSTLSEEENAFLEELNNTDSSQENFRHKLKELRKFWLNKLNATTVDKEKVELLMKKFSRKVRHHIRHTGDNLHEVNEKLNVAGNYYQGDIVLVPSQMDSLVTTEEKRAKRQAYKDRFYPRTIWPNNMVYYYFDNSLSQKARNVIALAIRFWQQNTCISFSQSSSASNRIRFFPGQGCYSNVGKIGGQQDISIGQGCESVGTAAHEIGHALGFFHEQSRYDRDSYINVLVQNIQPGWVDQFDKETPSTNDNYNMRYDYGSVMHYAGTSASRNGNPTMQARDAQYQDTMGSDIVSFRDVNEMNMHYSCKARCQNYNTPCQNGGFPHPRDCTKCLCPAGYGGDYCNQRPQGCGATLTATSTPKTLTANVGDGVSSEKDQFVYCNWRIQADPGKRIQVRITSYQTRQCTLGCVYGGIELKAQADQTMTGYRYCCGSDVGETVTSVGNVLPLIAFNRYNAERFSIQYVAV